MTGTAKIVLGLAGLWVLTRPKATAPFLTDGLIPSGVIPDAGNTCECFAAPCNCGGRANLDVMIEPWIAAGMTYAEWMGFEDPGFGYLSEEDAAAAVAAAVLEQHPDDFNGFDYYDSDHDGRISVSDLSRAISDKNRGLATQVDVDRVTARYNVREETPDGMIRTGQYLEIQVME